jgi:hypothetical protein
MRAVPQGSLTTLLGFPHAGWLIAVGAAAVVAEIAALLVAKRQGEEARRVQRAAVRGNWEPASRMVRPSLALPAVSILAPFCPVVLALVIVQGVRATILQAAVADAPDKAVVFASALVEELGALSCGLLCGAVAGMVGCLTVALTLSGRVRTAGLLRAIALRERHPVAGHAWARYPGPLPSVVVACVGAFVTLGGGPAALGLFAALQAKIRALQAAQQIATEARAAFLDQALAAASVALDRDFLSCCFGVSLAGMVTATIGWIFSSERRRRTQIGRSEARPISRAPEAFVLPVVMFAVATWLFFLAAPIKSENAAPWPPAGSAGLNLNLGLTTPALEGPDQVERAPVLELTSAGLSLDRVPLDGPGQIASRLAALRGTTSLLQPTGRFDGTLVVACTAETPATRIFEALRAAGAAGYRHPVFVFQRREAAVRPLLGTFRRIHTTAAQTSVIDGSAEADPAVTTVIRPHGNESCADLCARVVTARGGGRRVAFLAGNEARPLR